MYTEKFLIEDDSIGHVFISSKNSLFASNAISALDVRNDTIPLIGYSEWLDYNVISVDQFQDLMLNDWYNFFEKESTSYKYLDDFFVSSYKEKSQITFY